MVQKKLPNKLGINDDHVKTEKGLLARLKQSFSQQHDAKNRGSELKKKMKKSKSIKRSDLESLSLRSPPPPPPGKPAQNCGGFPGGAGGFVVPKKQSPAKPAGGSPPLQTRKLPPPQPPVKQEPPPQPGKPPQSVGLSFLFSKKQSPVKQTEGSPNYMKSTSSFEARKEERSRSPVSTYRNPQPSISPKTPNPKSIISNSKHKSSSSSKGSRSLSRTSSLKLVRTLTKSPSFKPSRSLSKKCSPVVLCEDFDAQKPTCSSTLKDSKFPNYLTLTPGSTEAEGTSAMKVCPYTYCSLNGHHHAPLPPLKCFLSARRRVLKSQKSFKLGCLSPRKTKPKESVSNEKGGDFFVEIYTKDGEDLSEKVDDDVVKNQKMEVDEERKSNIQMGEGEFEGCDMDWEAGEYSEGYVEEVSNCCFKELVPDEVIKVLFDEQSVGSEPFFDDQDSSSNSESYGFEESTNSEERSFALVDEITGESTDKSGDSCLFLENQESDSCEDFLGQEISVFDTKDEIEEGESFQEQGNSCLFHGNQESDSCDDSRDQEITEFDAQENIEEYESLQDDVGSCLFLGNQEPDSCQDFLGEELSDFDARDEIEEGESFQEQENQESDSRDQELAGFDAQEDIKECESPHDDAASCLFLGNQDVFGQEPCSDEAIDEIKENECSQTTEEFNESTHVSADKDTADETKDPPLNKQLFEQDGAKNYDLPKVEDESQDKIPILNKETSKETKNQGLYKRGNKNEESLEDIKNPKWGGIGKRISEESGTERTFNPREPNYLPVEPDEDGEKVDLRHQMMDERKNAEEWMVDFALRRVVNNLAPARKRKVALLVEAFEKVMPIPKYEHHYRHNSSAFALSPRPIQACR